MSTDDTPLLLDPDGSPLPYATAVTELESILQSLESATVDVDSLATQVERATHLIGHCRARLATVEGNVAAVLSGAANDAEEADD